MFCKFCIEGHIDDERDRGRQNPRCPTCGDEFSGYDQFEGPALDTSHGSAASRVLQEKHRSRTKKNEKNRRKKFGIASPGQDANGISLSKGPTKSIFLDACDEKPQEPLPGSTKTTAVLDIVRRWQRESPDDKIIIFTQFTLAAKILGRIFNAEKIPFLYYNGDLGIQERNNAVRAFEMNDTIKVMVSNSTENRPGSKLTTRRS